MWRLKQTDAPFIIIVDKKAANSHIFEAETRNI